MLKYFFIVIYATEKLAFILGKFFQASLICADKARSLPTEWDNLPGTNPIVYILLSVSDKGKCL
jgi:hypothetical protein